ncbi:hypothetical protein VQH23_26480 (plasmid) [Pararoseomonas sp. SCSIO 73927]|uniref:hypothetical protein n=1 Tax=Pararoseomonas sp. SCSIO 73927 TaxID=3114537 RepID=UPI0030CB24A9
MAAAPNKKQLSKIQRQKATLRAMLWPGLDDKRLWNYTTTAGWLNVPRALPLILRIMDYMSKGKPLSSTYLDLWCRTYNDSFVVASKPREMAFYSGFSGERAERTWQSRMWILAQLGFIDIKGGPNGDVSYILIFNPFAVLKEHHEHGRVDARSYNALLERMIETGGGNLSAEAGDDLDDIDLSNIEETPL